MPNVFYVKHNMLCMTISFVYKTSMLFEIGKQIRKERKRRKISQEKVSQDLGMSRSTVSQIEAGIVQEIGVRKLIRILDYLGLEIRVRQAGAPPTLDELRGEYSQRFTGTIPGWHEEVVVTENTGAVCSGSPCFVCRGNRTDFREGCGGGGQHQGDAFDIYGRPS